MVYNDGTSASTPYDYQWLAYGGRYFYGSPWVTVNGKYIRKVNIKDGTQITDNLGVNYILKQMNIQTTPLSANSSNCSNLTANAVDNESNITSKTTSDILTIDTGWTMPTIAGNNPKVIDGVVQF